MRRLLRWTFHTLAAASLLLCVATAGLWVRSYWVYDLFFASAPAASDSGGAFTLMRTGALSTPTEGSSTAWFGWSDPRRDQPAPRWEFELSRPGR